MKINLGPYSGDLVPIRRWRLHYDIRSTYDHTSKYDRAVGKIFDILENMFRPLNNWSQSRPRKVSIRVDNYDVWNADHTLALIIHPVLLKLKEQKQGAPHVDKEDIPEELHDKEWYIGWNYVLDEMIWAFEQCCKDDKGEDQFVHNLDQLVMISSPVEGTDLYSIDLDDQKDPTKPKFYVDSEAQRAHYDRVENGLRLFAKYYFSLWT